MIAYIYTTKNVTTCFFRRWIFSGMIIFVRWMTFLTLSTTILRNFMICEIKSANEVVSSWTMTNRGTTLKRSEILPKKKTTLSWPKLVKNLRLVVRIHSVVTDKMHLCTDWLFHDEKKSSELRSKSVRWICIRPMIGKLFKHSGEL